VPTDELSTELRMNRLATDIAIDRSLDSRSARRLHRRKQRL